MGGASADIAFESTSIPGDVSIDTVEVEVTTYHVVSVADFPLLMSEPRVPGLTSKHFVLLYLYWVYILSKFLGVVQKWTGPKGPAPQNTVKIRDSVIPGLLPIHCHF